MHCLLITLAISLFSCQLSDAGVRIKRQARCSKDQHMCTNRQCINATSLCDGSPDCNDGSDETPSTCSQLNFSKSRGHALLRRRRGLPDCGVKKLLIEPSKVGVEYPWHAVLYDKRHGKFEHICGGTIITPHVILTAAHCVYDEISQKAREASMLKVAVGKYTRSWDIIDPYEQKRDVREVVPHTSYKGYKRSFASDIAILDLVSNIDLNNFVLPACVHWSEQDPPTVGTLATIVVWGLTEQRSEVVKSATLTYIDNETCFNQASESFKRYITNDKFCAGYKNGTEVKSGDAGGGLTIPDPRSSRHYIFGILSLKPVGLFDYVALTDVSVHRDWMAKVIKALSKFHPQ